MPTEPRRQSQDLVLTVAEPQYRASQEHSIRSFRPSATTTTGFTDANVDATVVGNYVLPEDGTLRSNPRQVKSFSSTTATIDAAWATVGSVTAIRAWLPPDVPVRITTGHASNIVSTDHAAITNEPDAYWVGKGYSLCFKSGANAGRSYPIATFTAATGTFTVTGALAGATVVGDLAEIRKPIRPAVEVNASIKAKSIQRKIIGTGSTGGDMPIILANEGSVSVEIEARPIATAGASGIAASAPIELGDVLEDHFTKTSSTGGTITAIDATSVTTTAGVFSANGFALLANGKLIHITAASGANITGYGTGQAGFATVPTSSVAYASTSYVRRASGNLTRCWDLYRGGKIRQIFHGCMPTLEIDIVREKPVVFKFAYGAGECFQYNVDRPVAFGAANPISIPDIGVPTDGKGARMLIDGTQVVVQSLNVKCGLKPTPRPSLSGVGQMDGMFMEYEAPTGQMKIYSDNDDIAGFKAMFDRIASGRPAYVLYQKGTAATKTFGLAMPTMTFTGGEIAPDGGQYVATIDFTCVSPEVASDATDTALFPAATYPGLAELSFGWC